MKINTANYITSAISKEHWIKDDVSEICLIGRSNVGKSTFINSLCNQKKLARTSSVPGKTIKLNFFSINNNQFRLVDAPGYGYAKLSHAIKKQFALMMEQYLNERLNLKAVILLLDLRRIPSEDDILMYKFLQQKNIPLIFVLTKTDKVKKNEIKKQEQLILNKLKIKNKDNFILTSSATKIGYDKVLEILADIL